MSDASPGDARDSEPHECDYYQTIEESFVALRGDPLILSNADWLMIRKWRMQGVPLRIVLRGIRDAFETHAHSWARKQKVGSLRYCQTSVDGAYERWALAVSPASDEGGDVASWLRQLADEIARAAPLSDTLARQMAELAEALRQRAQRPDRKTLEAWLLAEEQRLVEGIRRALDAATLDRIIQESEEELRPYRARMPARVFEQVLQEALSRRLLATCGLPRLSLLFV
jgi:hypothetical protein